MTVDELKSLYNDWKTARAKPVKAAGLKVVKVIEPARRGLGPRGDCDPRSPRSPYLRPGEPPATSEAIVRQAVRCPRRAARSGAYSPVHGPMRRLQRPAQGRPGSKALFEQIGLGLKRLLEVSPRRLEVAFNQVGRADPGVADGWLGNRCRLPP